MSFDVKNELLEKFNEVWCKVNNIEKTFDTQPIFEEK